MMYEMLITCIVNKTPIHNNLLLSAVITHRNQICALKRLKSCKTGGNRLLAHYSNWLWPLNRRNTPYKDFMENINIIHILTLMVANRL